MSGAAIDRFERNGRYSPRASCTTQPGSLRRREWASLTCTAHRHSPGTPHALPTEVFHVLLVCRQIGRAALIHADSDQLARERRCVVLLHKANALADYLGRSPTVTTDQPIQGCLRFLIQPSLHQSLHRSDCTTKLKSVVQVSSCPSTGRPSRSPSYTRARSSAASAPSGPRRGNRASSRARRAVAECQTAGIPRSHRAGNRAGYE